MNQNLKKKNLELQGLREYKKVDCLMLLAL